MAYIIQVNIPGGLLKKGLNITFLTSPLQNIIEKVKSFRVKEILKVKEDRVRFSFGVRKGFIQIILFGL